MTVLELVLILWVEMLIRCRHWACIKNGDGQLELISYLISKVRIATKAAGDIGANRRIAVYEGRQTP